MHSAAEHTLNTVGLRHRAAVVVQRAAAVEQKQPQWSGNGQGRGESGRTASDIRAGCITMLSNATHHDRCKDMIDKFRTQNLIIYILAH